MSPFHKNRQFFCLYFFEKKIEMVKKRQGKHGATINELYFGVFFSAEKINRRIFFSLSKNKRFVIE